MRVRAVIDDVVSSFSPKLTSHKAGWARMQRCMVEDTFQAAPRDWRGQANTCELLGPKDEDRVHEASTWLVSHAMEFSGKGYNLFGGWSADTHRRVKRLAEFEGTVMSLERPMPDLQALLRPAAEKTQSNLTAAQWDEVSRKCATASPPVTHLDLLRWAGHATPDVVLGDSHSVAHYLRGRLVLRNDGLTLHGLLKRGLEEVLRETVDYDFSELTICAGNIDIRHHLLRQPDPREAVDALVNELARQLERLYSTGTIERYTVVLPLPIEHEARRIPGSGCFKGTPFFGSQAERDEIRSYMDDTLLSMFGEEHVHAWPKEWYTMSPEDYAAERMEKPSSVHLSPAWHRWDYINNEART